MGAWVETTKQRKQRKGLTVAPFVGAWVETLRKRVLEKPPGMSRPSWARGLKQQYAPAFRDAGMSRPSWARGLKLIDIKQHIAHDAVAPFVGAWVETLMRLSRASITYVAPFVGAWVETCKEPGRSPHHPSRPSWARGLKHNSEGGIFTAASRALRGRVG